MKCIDIIDRIEDWAPRDIAWDRDNAGLQIGSAEREVKKILLTLDLTEPALDKAIELNCNLIITHHPLLFNPIKQIDTQNDPLSRLIEKLIKNDITLYSAHTNLDFTKDGVSYELAKVLGLKDISFLKELEANQSKVVVFVPVDALGIVSQAIFNNGGGRIGEYSGCSFRTEGSGTFIGSEKTNPAVGEKETSEIVEEVRLEVITNNWNLNRIISDIKRVHPYEEPAYDIYPLKNRNLNYGVGAIGSLDKSIGMDAFLDYAAKKLNIRNFRYSGRKETIRRVAVCGGSGSDYLKEAIRGGADAFITADLKYHAFQEAMERILLIDAGHFETEVFALDAIESYLQKNFNQIEIKKYTDGVNPVNFYKNKGAK
jgi:dinuclear metal center YbgI/SA1388 family protein